MGWVDKSSNSYWTGDASFAPIPTWTIGAPYGTPPTDPYWTGGSAANSRLVAGGWATGYRPTHVRITSTVSDISSLNSNLYVRDTSGAIIATMVFNYGGVAGTWNQQTAAITFGANDIADIYDPGFVDKLISSIEFLGPDVSEFWTSESEGATETVGETCPV